MNNTDEILDFTLTEISNFDGFVVSKKIFKVLMPKISENDVTPIIDKLYRDGYIDKIIDEIPNNSILTPQYHCRINFHGKLFLSRGGYVNQTKTSILNRTWTVIKTFAITINSIIILSIAYFTLSESIKERQIEETNRQIIKKINAI